MKVQHAARLHETTVQKIALGQPLSKVQRRHTTQQKWGISVNPVMAEVIRKVRRPGTTIRIIDEDTVLIVNRK